MHSPQLPLGVQSLMGAKEQRWKCSGQKQPPRVVNEDWGSPARHLRTVLRAAGRRDSFQQSKGECWRGNPVIGTTWLSVEAAPRGRSL